MKSTILPENILKCVSAADRKALGQKTAAETLAAGKAKCERDLQTMIVTELQRRGIEVFRQRMDKKTRGPKGQPDLIFAVKGRAIAWEVKTQTGKLSLKQQLLGDEMIKFPNQWSWRVIRSFDSAVLELRNLGL